MILGMTCGCETFCAMIALMQISTSFGKTLKYKFVEFLQVFRFRFEYCRGFIIFWYKF